MRYIDKEYVFEFEEKKSKFISYLLPYRDFKEKLEELKKTYSKARHFVWAYRYIENNQVIENQTDDKEPKGTAGKPTLNVLKKQNIVNSAIITVRYFGGIKLGANGLTKAYSKTASEVVKLADFKEYINWKEHSFFIRYPDVSKAEYILKEFEIKTVEKRFEEKGVNFFIKVNKNIFEKIENSMKTLIYIKK